MNRELFVLAQNYYHRVLGRAIWGINVVIKRKKVDHLKNNSNI